jgi:hypothetical protein
MLGLGRGYTMNEIDNNTSSVNSDEQNDPNYRSRQTLGRLMAKTLTLPEFWEYQIPDDNSLRFTMCACALDDMKVLKNPKNLKQVINVMNNYFLTYVGGLPRKAREIIAKSFLAALDLERIEALVHERIGIN